MIGRSVFSFLLLKYKIVKLQKKSRPLSVYFRPCLIEISITILIIQIEKSIDGVLGIRTWGCTMVGADKATELWCFSLTGIISLLAKRITALPLSSEQTVF